jgi:hypothetical protein
VIQRVELFKKSMTRGALAQALAALRPGKVVRNPITLLYRPDGRAPVKEKPGGGR